MCVRVRDEQRHQALEPPRTPPITKKRQKSLSCAVYHAQATPRQRSTFVSALYLSFIHSRMSLSASDPTSERLCVFVAQLLHRLMSDNVSRRILPLSYDESASDISHPFATYTVDSRYRKIR